MVSRRDRRENGKFTVVWTMRKCSFSMRFQLGTNCLNIMFKNKLYLINFPLLNLTRRYSFMNPSKYWKRKQSEIKYTRSEFLESKLFMKTQSWKFFILFSYNNESNAKLFRGKTGRTMWFSYITNELHYLNEIYKKG